MKVFTPWDSKMSTFRAHPASATQPIVYDTPAPAGRSESFYAHGLPTPETPSKLLWTNGLNANPSGRTSFSMEWEYSGGTAETSPSVRCARFSFVTSTTLMSSGLASVPSKSTLLSPVQLFCAPPCPEWNTTPETVSNTDPFTSHVPTPALFTVPNNYNTRPPTSPLLSPLHIDVNMDAFDSEPAQSNENKENFSIPHLRVKRSKTKAIQDALSILRASRVSPTELLNVILDESQDTFASYRTAFYAEPNAERLQELLRVVWNNVKGHPAITDWMRPHAIELVSKIVSDEMESAKPSLLMYTHKVTPKFIETWDINEIMEPIGRDKTPTWTKILESATETKDSKEKDESEKSRNHRTVMISLKSIQSLYLIYNNRDSM